LPTSTEWDEDAKTVVEEDAVTAPHEVLQLPGYDVGRNDGCIACCRSCQEEVFAALELVCLSRGLTKSETEHIILAVRRKITPV
jgi:hypothetical protein